MSKDNHTPLLSSRAVNTPASPIRSLSRFGRQAKAEGKTVHYLNIGQPDLASPVEFTNAVKEFDRKVISYDISEGNANLRSAWINRLNANLGTNLTADNMLITTGASEGLVFAFMVCCDPGAEVLVFEPSYANYMGFAAISGVNLVPVPTSAESNFHLPAQSEIENRLTSNTRAILLCNPNNPTGTVYSKDELKMLLDLCEEHNLFFIIDETYRGIVFDNQDLASMIVEAQNNQRVIVIDSLSKRYSLCGARLGNIISSNQEFLAKTLNIAQARLSSPNIEQFAAAKMLEQISLDYIRSVKIEYENRRNVLIEGLNQIPKCKAIKPAGAFYTMLELPVKDATEFAKFLLKDFSFNNETVFVAPAEGFYIAANKGKNQVRIAMVLNQEKLSKSIEIIAKALEAYPID